MQVAIEDDISPFYAKIISRQRLDNRDEIPQILRGLQHLYSNKEKRSQIFKILLDMIPEDIDPTNGRNGMDLWNIFVLGTLRLKCRWDYDKLHEIANNHRTLRQILGHGMLDDTFRYTRQTLNDNLRWLTPELLDRINVLIVNEGRECLGKTPDDVLHGRCDSFVVETDVNFPTDINLLWDAIRKTLQLTQRLCDLTQTAGWRQVVHLIKKVKTQYRTVQKMRDKNKGDDNKHSDNCYTATQTYINTCADLFNRARETVTPLRADILYGGYADEIIYFIEHGLLQIDQIYRRCFKDEAIPHVEKVFSIFEPHTEWIVKGKAGIAQELGVRVCIVESSDQFILHHMVMENKTDDQIAAQITKEAKERFPTFKSCSYDKGFHSPQNQEDLRKELEFVVMPKKGRLNAKEQEHEGSERFEELRRKHSAVESAINALEHTGLDMCRDNGIEGFKRYIALSVVAKNIHRLGCILQEQELTKARLLRNKVA
jgi:transposase, IS5 family